MLWVTVFIDRWLPTNRFAFTGHDAFLMHQFMNGHEWKRTCIQLSLAKGSSYVKLNDYSGLRGAEAGILHSAFMLISHRSHSSWMVL